MPNLPEATFGRKVRPKAKTGPIHDAPNSSSAASDVASYVAEIATQLEAMASGVGLDLLAYFLRLAQLEARSKLRPSQTESSDRSPNSPVGEYKSGEE